MRNFCARVCQHGSGSAQVKLSVIKMHIHVRTHIDMH